jgi:hypothetical protein
MTYTGAPGLVEVVQKNGDTVFSANLNTGEQFTFNGTERDGKLGNEIKIYVDGVENVKIHTSCSQDIGPGMTFGDFMVDGGESKDGGPLCPLSPPPDDPPGDCSECKGGVLELTMTYNGPVGLVEVMQKNGDTVFSGALSPGDQFTFNGTEKGGKLGNEITIYVDGVENVKIHTSCSQAIGPGMTFGDFTVDGGESKDGGPLCPLAPPPNGGDLTVCTTKVIGMTLEYIGPAIGGSSTVVFEFKKNGMVVFNGVNLGPGTVLTVASADDGENDFGAKTSILINGTEEVIHTSCSATFEAGEPAPLDDPKGDPSPNWLVVEFDQKPPK